MPLDASVMAAVDTDSRVATTPPVRTLSSAGCVSTPTLKPNAGPHDLNRRRLPQPSSRSTPSKRRDPRPPTTHPHRRAARCSPATASSSSASHDPWVPIRDTPGVAACSMSGGQPNIAARAVHGGAGSLPGASPLHRTARSLVGARHALQPATGRHSPATQPSSSRSARKGHDRHAAVRGTATGLGRCALSRGERMRLGCHLLQPLADARDVHQPQQPGDRLRHLTLGAFPAAPCPPVYASKTRYLALGHPQGLALGSDLGGGQNGHSSSATSPLRSHASWVPLAATSRSFWRAIAICSTASQCRS